MIGDYPMIGEPHVDAGRHTGMSALRGPRVPSARLVAITAVAGCLLALGACARAASTPGASAAGGGAPGAGAVAPVDPSISPGEPPSTVANVEAARILAAFQPPAGARHLTVAPAGAGNLAPTVPGTPNLVTRTGWWQVTGAPAAILGAITAAPPSGASMSARSGVGGAGGATSSGVSFDWPPIHAVLASRQMQVDVAQIGANTVIRVDAQVAYLATRPVGSLIPATATVAVVTFDNRGLGVVTEQDEFGPVTVTDATQVAQVANLINSAETQLPGLRACPGIIGGGGNGMQVVFRASSTGPNLATVTIVTSGCTSMTVRPAGGAPTTLDGGPDQIIQIETIFGLTWPKPAQ